MMSFLHHFSLLEIVKCCNLSHLQLQHNDLTELPLSLGDLKSLKRLGLQYNQLSELPASLCNCTELNEIGLESNTLTSLPVRDTYTRDNY